MERTVPRAASEEVDLYVRTLYSLLRSTTDVQLRTLEEVHAGMNSLLHTQARAVVPDMSALLYSLLRLPPVILQVQSVLLGQSAEVFSRHGFGEIETWQPVSAVARRRRCYFDGRSTLACFIASRTDIDDVIPTLVALQLEWNKLHEALTRFQGDFNWDQVHTGDPDALNCLARVLQITGDDLGRLQAVWGEQFAANLQIIAQRRASFSVRLLSGSLNEYRRATRAWWQNIANRWQGIEDRPIYFISSNMHSISNLLSGYALQKRAELIAYLERIENIALLNEWRAIRDRDVAASEENFLYYTLKKYQQDAQHGEPFRIQAQAEAQVGIMRIPSEHAFDVDAQIIELARLNPQNLDPRLQTAVSLNFLPRSNALILNIDYPLGLAAYNLLTKIAESTGAVLGVYIMGKAASLNARHGDVMLPNVVHDEHSSNTFLFENAFQAADVSPYLRFGAVLDNQKAVTVMGTFLQNAHYMEVFYREGYTDIEMEAGPYLSAVYEMYRPKRHPVNEIVNLHNLPFPIGMLHYVSDTPLSKGKNLGAGTLSYFGMDSTYAASLAILARIFEQENRRLNT